MYLLPRWERAAFPENHTQKTLVYVSEDTMHVFTFSDRERSRSDLRRLSGLISSSPPTASLFFFFSFFFFGSHTLPFPHVPYDIPVIGFVPLLYNFFFHSSFIRFAFVGQSFLPPVLGLAVAIVLRKYRRFPTRFFPFEVSNVFVPRPMMYNLNVPCPSVRLSLVLLAAALSFWIVS